MADVITVGGDGLYCPAGGFHIDPWRPVARAVVTHAHGDHLRRGSGHYLVAAGGVELARCRLDPDADVAGQPFGEPRRIGDATVSFHPAGHCLGSAQIRVETGDGVWVVSGDYKRAADPSCEAFEVVACDVFITEATFALPIYRWPPGAEVARQVLDWWDACAERGAAAVLFCYALGKAQRLLAELARLTDRSVWIHGALEALVEVYRAAGVDMLPTRSATEAERGQSFAGDLILAPPSANGTPWMRRFGKTETGFASGWMRVRGMRRRRGFDRGFVISDHADWPALLDTVAATGASRILPTHGYAHPLSRYLREQGCDAQPLATHFEGEAAEDAVE